MKYVLALDQGTTSSRALLFDRDARIVSLAQREFPQHFPRPGWVEHDPRDIWESQLHVAREALAAAGASAADVAAVGIANQRETTLLWDRETGEPVYNAIVWQDRRTAAFCRSLVADGHADRLTRHTGLVADSYFAGTKLHWMLEHVEGVRERAEAGRLAFGTVDSWLLWQLTGGRVHATDATNASRTLLYDIHEGRWNDDLLNLFGVPRSVLPEVRDTSGVVAETDPAIFGEPLPVAGIAGDQQAALFGQACFPPGLVKNTFGTGCFALTSTGTEPVTSQHRLLTTIAWQRAGETVYALEGSVFVAGAVVQWLRDELGLIQSAADVEALAATVPDSGGVTFVPAFTGLGTPHWNPDARGTILGLTRGTKAGHLARAAIEGIAHQVADVLEAIHADSGLQLHELRADGGGAANDLLLQTQADLLGIPVVRPTVLETTALGAAYLAGLAVGYWTSLDDLAAHWQVDRRFEPTDDTARVHRERDRWRRGVERAADWNVDD